MSNVLKPCYFINPKFYESNGKKNDVINPATLKKIAERTEVTEKEINSALDKVNEAQKKWASVNLKTRAAMLHQLANKIEQTDMSKCATLMTKEMGKPYPEAIGEIANCASVFRYYAEMARDQDGKIAGATEDDSLQYAKYYPVGVSAHIMPFNFPILLMCWTVAASLAAGNGCVIKPAEATTLCTLEFSKVFGVMPQNLIACLPGNKKTGNILVNSKKTHAVAFTGSVSAAKDVAKNAAKNMKPAVIEAGGADPMIISSHAPIDVAAAGAVTGAFHLSGQVCTSTEKIFVVDSVHDMFVEKFAQETKKLRIGNGQKKSEIGPLVSEKARQKVQRLVNDATKKGAKIICGGKVPKNQNKGWFYEPTILTECTPKMDIMKEEVFGPVVSIVRAPDFDAAINMANKSNFGLGASVFTTDLSEAHEAAEKLEAGMVWVNNPMIDNDALPFGGWKQSGIGRELSRMGLNTFRKTKMIVLNHKPIRQEWWYPYPDDWFLSEEKNSGRKHV